MEEIIVVAIVFGSLLAALKLILDFVRDKRGVRSVDADRSITTTQLSDMIDEEVAIATKSLEKRVENLEAIAVETPILPEGAASGRLELPIESETDTEAAEAAVRNRARS
ncbi:MAG: hypothetical protein KJO98_08260 [Rhodothermia bacterium]|nr:hypothetical protein [Rhodothermia bacterium]